MRLEGQGQLMGGSEYEMQEIKIKSCFPLHRESDLGREIPFPNYECEENGKRTGRWCLMSLCFYLYFCGQSLLPAARGTRLVGCLPGPPCPGSFWKTGQKQSLSTHPHNLWDYYTRKQPKQKPLLQFENLSWKHVGGRRGWGVGEAGWCLQDTAI